MGAMLLARSASTSTGRRNVSSEPQPEPLILGLVPDQPAPGAITDRVHTAPAAPLARRQRWGAASGRPARRTPGHCPQDAQVTMTRCLPLRWHEERLPASESLWALSACGDAHAGASRLPRPVTKDARRGR